MGVRIICDYQSNTRSKVKVGENMQNISSNQKEHLYEGGNVGVTITGETLDGTLITVTEDDIIEGSFSIDRNWVSGSTIEIGCADTSELVFELDNTDGQWSNLRWEGTRLTVVFDIAEEPLQAGIFIVDEPPRKLTTMQIRALDNMARFNRLYDSTCPYPATLLQILQDACSRCNVTLHTQTFSNCSYVVAQRPVGDDITYHHVVAWVAELAGCNAWMDEYGRLRLSWYGENQPADSPTEVYFLSSDMPAQVRSYSLSIGPDDRFSYEAAEADIEITGIVYRTDDVDYLAGNNKYALVIEENLLLQENYETVLNSLLAKLGGFKYRPYKFETLGYPHLWPGDAITRLVDAEGNETASIITNHTYKLNGNSTLEAKGETEAVRGYATGAPFTPSQKRVLQAVAKVEAARQTTALEQATLQLNELMVNSLGFYTTAVELETGAKIVYTHDKPELENSLVIWTRTEQGFAWTDQGWQGGNPAWQYGVTGDGSMVVKLLTARGIDADWVNVTDLTALSSEDGSTRMTGSGVEVFDPTGKLMGHFGRYRTTEQASFSRNSDAYLSDGTKVAADVPRFEQGKFGKGILIEEGTTNLITDPFFADASKWPTKANAHFNTNFPGIFNNGTFMALCSGVDAAGKTGYCYCPYTVAAGDTVSMTVYMQMSDKSEPMLGDSGTGRIGLVLSGKVSSVRMKKQRILNTDYWKITSFTVGDGSGSNTGVVYYNAPEGRIYPIFMGIQFEKRAYATTFIDGTRYPEALTIPDSVLNQQEGEIEGKTLVTKEIAGGGNWHGFLCNRFPSGDWGLYFARTPDVEQKFRLRWGTSLYEFNSPITLTESDWVNFKIKWNAQVIKVLLNGVVALEQENLQPNIVFDEKLYLGSHKGISEFCNTVLDDIRISNKCRTDEEDLAAYQSGEPLPFDSHTTAKLDFDGNLDVAMTKHGLYLAGGNIGIDTKIYGGDSNVEHTGEYSQWNHADGSYTRADAEGLLRYVAGANRNYHYLMHVGTGSITASNWGSEIVITLPPEFKNKDFRVFAMISGYSGPDHVIFKNLLVQSGIKSQTNGTMWVKGASAGNMAEGVFGAIDDLGKSIPGFWFRGTGGAMYDVTLNFAYIAIA